MNNQPIKEFNVTIPSSRLAEMQNRIDALNRKAVKYGISPIIATLGIETARQIDEQNTILVTPVSVKFQPIVIAGGWSFQASIEHDIVNDQYRNVVSGYDLEPDVEVKYRCIASSCESNKR